MQGVNRLADPVRRPSQDDGRQIGTALTVGQQLLMMVTLMITSKGVAAVPRASLVILTATAIQFFGEENTWPITLILGVDVLMDMGRTSVNLIGNCLATAVMARWEGEAEWDGKED